MTQNIDTSDAIAQLVTAAQDGDQDALGQLAEHFKPRVYAFLMQKTSGDHDLSEDLTQETFVHLLRSIGSYEPKARFSTWLLRVANNRLVDFKRRAVVRGEVSQEDLDPAAPEPTGLADDERAQLAEAIGNLTDKQRTVIALRFFEGLSYAEIAEICGWKNPSTVNYTLYRALEALKRALGGEDPEQRLRGNL